MEAVRVRLEQMLLVEITMLNGENTEEDLNMAIVKEIIKERLQQKESLILERFSSENDKAEIEPNGVYVYVGGLLEDFSFERYNTMADAVRAAVNKVGAKVICEGCLVTYDTLNDTEAYYVDDKAGKVKLVKLCA